MSNHPVYETITSYQPDNLRLPGYVFRTTDAVLAAGEGELPRGSVLGRVTRDISAVTPGAGNTGDGTAVSVALGRATKRGRYLLTARSDATFTVEDPDGYRLSDATAGTPFTSPAISFELQAGGTPFADGDTIEITIGKGSGELRQLRQDSIDGSAEPYAILMRAADTTTEADTVPIDVEGGYNAKELHFATGENHAMYREKLWARGIYTETTYPL